MDAITRFKILWQGYLTDTLNASEAEELLTLIRKDEFFHKDHIAGLLAAPPELGIESKEGDEIFEELLSRIHEPAQVTRRIPYFRRWSWAAAAVIVIGTAIAIAVSNNHRSETSNTTVTTNSPAGIPPGKEGAVLTLADGRQVVLDSLGNGVVATQNGTQVVLNDGRLTYDPTENTTGAIVYNTMSTPKGRQFSVRLPDGTKVWLNAASSIRYPTVFTGKERKVEVTGEVYFEVVKNSKMPFRVTVSNIAEVEVLGTHFNVNAYTNENLINTTLLEGSIKLNGTIIKPGQQARIAIGQTTASQHVSVINDANTEQVMAWKNGFINFEGATFDAIMRQLERWYDIQVVYDNNKIPTTRLAGKMTRGVPLDGLLKNLEALGVHFRLDGRKLIILQ
ncbi:FecR family protein [Pseudobacter ginsenosidimutans]|uniref:FecR family protein n=1 Tax=Pseudobacter ginsenosidimutans TaxID=661488 RepID=A0A4Q7N096_9BACT|nr:FecR domain-containing protein [Pseudobacter ginsenosidimutans]RZS74673.1 FecR family protein [Pseudobacter ginsenosidimutans]